MDAQLEALWDLALSQPEALDTWNVLADALSQAGDERGAFLQTMLRQEQGIPLRGLEKTLALRIESELRRFLPLGGEGRHPLRTVFRHVAMIKALPEAANDARWSLVRRLDLAVNASDPLLSRSVLFSPQLRRVEVLSLDESMLLTVGPVLRLPRLHTLLLHGPFGDQRWIGPLAQAVGAVARSHRLLGVSLGQLQEAMQVPARFEALLNTPLMRVELSIIDFQLRAVAERFLSVGPPWRQLELYGSHASYCFHQADDRSMRVEIATTAEFEHAVRHQLQTATYLPSPSVVLVPRIPFPQMF